MKLSKTTEKILIAIFVIVALPLLFLLVSVSAPCGSELRNIVDAECKVGSKP